MAGAEPAFVTLAVKDGLISKSDLVKIRDVAIAREMGWTMEYIENMDLQKKEEIIAIIEGQNKAGMTSSKKFTKRI